MMIFSLASAAKMVYSTSSSPRLSPHLSLPAPRYVFALCLIFPFSLSPPSPSFVLGQPQLLTGAPQVLPQPDQPPLRLSRPTVCVCRSKCKLGAPLDALVRMYVCVCVCVCVSVNAGG